MKRLAAARAGGAIMFHPPVDASHGAPMAITGHDHRFIQLSDFYCEPLRRSRDELMRIDWHTIVHFDDFADHSRQREETLSTGKPFHQTCLLKRSDGRWLRGLFQITRLEQGAGRRPLLQSNGTMSADPVPDPVVVAVSTTERVAMAQLIHAVTRELAGLAGARRMKTLEHLLAMASTEAAEAIIGHLRTADGGGSPERPN